MNLISERDVFSKLPYIIYLISKQRIAVDAIAAKLSVGIRSQGFCLFILA